MAVVDLSGAFGTTEEDEEQKRLESGVVDLSEAFAPADNTRTSRDLGRIALGPESANLTTHRPSVKGAFTEVTRNEGQIRQAGGDVPPAVDEEKGILGEILDTVGAGSFVGGGLVEPLLRAGGRVRRGEDFKGGDVLSDIGSNLAAGATRAVPGLDDKGAIEAAELPGIFGEEFGTHPARAFRGVVPVLTALDDFANAVTGTKESDDPSKAPGPISEFATSMLAEMFLDPFSFGEGKLIDKAFRGVGDAVKPAYDAVVGASNPVVNALRKSFSPFGTLRQSERLGDVAPGATDKFRTVLSKTNAGVAQDLETIQGQVISLAADLNADELTAMGAFFRDPDALKDAVTKLAPDDPARIADIQGRAEAFGKLFTEWFDQENSVGALSKSQFMDHYIFGSGPVTKAGERFSDDILKQLPVTKKDLTANSNTSFGDAELKQAFQERKKYDDAVARLQDGLPTETDISMLAGKRGLLHTRTMATKRLLDIVIKDPTFGAEKIVGDLVPVKEGFAPFRLQSGGPGWMLPEDIATEINRVQGVFEAPGTVEKLARTYDKILAPWKGYKLLSVGYHTRNGYSNAGQNHLANISLDAHTQSARILTSKNLSPADAALKEEARALGVFGGGLYANEYLGQIEDVMQSTIKRGLKGASEVDLVKAMNQVGDIDPLALKVEDVAKNAGKEVSREDVIDAIGNLSRSEYKNKGKFGKIFGTDGHILRFNRAVGTAVEDGFRFAHYIGKKEQGLSPEDAMLSVKKYLFDYGELTDFERKVMKRVIPFYTWSRKNIPLMMEGVARDPSKFNEIGRALRSADAQFNDDPLEPDYFKEITKIRLPSGDEQTPLYALLDLPFNDLTLGAAGPGGVLGANPVTGIVGNAAGFDLRNTKFNGGLELRGLGDRPDKDVLSTLESLGVEPGIMTQILSNPRLIAAVKTASPSILNQIANIGVSGSARGDAGLRALGALGLPVKRVPQADEAANKLFAQRKRLRKIKEDEKVNPQFGIPRTLQR